MTAAPLTRLLVEAMAKHLPPSASALHVIDFSGRTGEQLLPFRPDCVPMAADAAQIAALPADQADAAFIIGAPPDDATLRAILRAMRAGGRLVIANADDDPTEERLIALGHLLETLGYTRILASAALGESQGVLLRGEKPHTQTDTLARVHIAADRDTISDARGDLAAFNGRFVHLLVRQLPNKPAWALTADDVITWEAVGVQGDDDQLLALAFSSLPKAVSFMQPLMITGTIKDVNKVAKFSRAAAEAWPFRVWLNPPPEALDGLKQIALNVDPASAVTGEE